MSKLGVIGCGLIALGALFAYFHDNNQGVLIASLCLIAGLVVIVASEARGLISKTRGARARRQPQILVLAKGDVHVYPHHNGRFREAPDPNQTDLTFEIFMQCWLVLGSEVSLRIDDVQLALTGPDGSAKTAERTPGDLKNWLLTEVEKVSESGSDWKKGAPRTTPLRLPEFDTVAPLQCGAAREGWLHFQIRDTTPSDLQNGSLELSITDSLSHVHPAAPIRVRRLPGSIHPIVDSNPPQLEGDQE